MSLLFDSISIGLAILFVILGFIGTIVPLLPGTLLLWLALFFYHIGTDFAVVSTALFILLTLIALVTGTADVWLAWLGAKKGGASAKAMLLGAIGAVIGTFIIPLLGTIIGYAAGILLAEYQQQGDWHSAIQASWGGIAGWGLATLVQFGGGLLMIFIFVFAVLI